MENKTLDTNELKTQRKATKIYIYIFMKTVIKVIKMIHLVLLLGI